MTVEIQESLGTLQGGTQSGLMRLRIITEGRGSSANYPAAGIIESAAAFPAGTHIHYDHPTVSESQERPERSVLTLAGALESDAEIIDVQEDGATVKALEAMFRPLPSEYQVIKERAGIIGASIRASAEVDDDGNVIRITEAHSVDLVTKAGRGGRITEVIESARREIAERTGERITGIHWDGQPITEAQHRSDAAWLAGGANTRLVEATDNDIRRYLSDAVDQAHDTEDQIAFLEDFDDTYIYFRASRFNRDDGTRHRGEYRQPYTRDGVTVTLTGEPEQVQPETVFTPTRPESDSSTAPAVESRSTATAGGHMVDIQESELTRLRDAEKNYQQLQEAHDTEKARADQAEQSLAEARTAQVTAQATSIVEAAFTGIDAPKAKARLIESATPEGFDEDTFKGEVEEAAAEFGAPGVQVSGFGATQSAQVQESTDFDYDTSMTNIFEGGR